MTYSDFINKELVLFSNCDNERSIPSIVDGFKPGKGSYLSLTMCSLFTDFHWINQLNKIPRELPVLPSLASQANAR